MKKSIIFALVAAAGLTAVLVTPFITTSGQKGDVRRSAEPIPNRYIVVLDENVIGTDAVEPEVEAHASSLSAIYGGSVRGIYSNAIKGFVSEMTPDQAQVMNSDPRVRIIEEDSLITVAEQQANAPWHLDRIDERVLPMDTFYAYSSTGAGANIYIVDTGIRFTHNDFGGRADAVYDNINDGQNGNDCHGHGTHVAGIAGSATYGVAKNASIHAVRVLPCNGIGQISNLIFAIDWLTANRVDPAVANISITASGSSPSLETALSNSIASGITYTVAAGNSAADACNYTPGRTPTALTVGASADSDVRAPYSNFGSCLDIFAPGHAVTSLSNANDTDTRVMNGTSMAAPIVAGTAALYLSANPSANPTAVGNAIKNAATVNIVGNMGAGSPDRLLYSLVTGPPPPPTPTPTATPTPTPSPTPTPQQAGRVKVKKMVQNASGTSSSTEFPYSAVNLAASNFTLSNNQLYDDPNVQVPTGQTIVTVTEAAVPGWRVVGIDCSEISSTPPGVVNSTVDVANRRANIVLEPGEEITCTFTSEPLAPTAATVSVSGRVTTPDGQGVRGIRLSLVDVNTGMSRIAVTNSFGYYSFFELRVQDYYVLSIRNKLYDVENGPFAFTLLDEITGMNFVVRLKKE